MHDGITKPINAMIQIPDENDREEIYFWKSKAVKNTQTIELLKRLKHACNKFGYGFFTISDFGSSNIPKKFFAFSDAYIPRESRRISVHWYPV